MMEAMLRNKPQRWQWLLWTGMLVALVYLLARSLGLYPAVFADELIYTTFSRLVPLHEASIPSFLYFALYRSTSVCGPAFLDCARALNVVLFVAAAPFIYLCTRRLAGPGAALAVALMSLLLPINSYTAFFMPESLYFLAFFLLTWLVLAHGAMHWASLALLSGLLLGAMTLIKVHALFLIPPLCLFAMYNCWARRSEGPWITRALGAAALTALAALAVKFGLGYLMGGPNALHLFGSFYGGQVNSSAARPLLSYLGPAWVNGRAHLMALALLFGLPLAIVIGGLVAAIKAGQARTPASALHLYTLLMGGAALAMTVMYTASISELAPREIERLHMRYYNFALPLLLMVAAGALAGTPRLALLDRCLATLLAVACVLGVLLLPDYALSMTDGPDIAALFLIKDLAATNGPDIASLPLLNDLAAALALLQIAALVLWALGRRGAVRLFLYAFMPLLLLAQNDALHFLMKQLAVPNAFDSAGLHARTHIPKAEHGEVAIAGSGLVLLMRAKFHIDEPSVLLIDMAPGAAFNLDHLPVRRKWLLVVGPHALPPELTPTYQDAQFALVQVQAAHRKIDAAEFAKPVGNGLIAALDGVDKIEPWGRWSNGPQVAIHFARPLPKKLNLLLRGQSYGPNAQHDYVLRVGLAEHRFRIGNAATEVFLRLDTDGLQDRLTIDIPHPVSPQEVEGSIDTRKLGLGLIGVEVGERP